LRERIETYGILDTAHIFLYSSNDKTNVFHRKNNYSQEFAIIRLFSGILGACMTNHFKTRQPLAETVSGTAAAPEFRPLGGCFLYNMSVVEDAGGAGPV